MKREFSAGGVVYKKSKVNWLVVQHSQHKGWVFPKGLIGDVEKSKVPPKRRAGASQKSKVNNQTEESIEEAALREVREEGGVIAKIIAPIPQTVEYWYQFQGEKILKKVYYYLMEYVGGNIADHDEEVCAVEWLTADEVKKRLTYNNDKKIFKIALDLYNNLDK